MARYDKYEPYAGGFRALLNADWLEADLNKAVGVGLNTSGLVVKGAGNTGVRGVLVLTKIRKAGAVVDVMTDGEITEFGGTAGTNYFAAAADGVINATSAAGKTFVGQTVEGGRLIVRVAGSVVPA